MVVSNRNLLFQWSIFKGKLAVSFRKGTGAAFSTTAARLQDTNFGLKDLIQVKVIGAGPMADCELYLKLICTHMYT